MRLQVLHNPAPSAQLASAEKSVFHTLFQLQRAACSSLSTPAPPQTTGLFLHLQRLLLVEILILDMLLVQISGTRLCVHILYFYHSTAFPCGCLGLRLGTMPFAYFLFSFPIEKHGDFP